MLRLLDMEDVDGGNRVRKHLEDIERSGSAFPRDAIAALIQGGESAVDPLLELLDAIEPDQDDWTPLWVTLALGEIKSPRAVGHLLKLLELPEGDTLSESAVEALAKIGVPALPGIMSFARSTPGWEARHYSYTALGLIPGDASLQFLISALGRDPMLWNTLASALADLGDPRAVAPLKNLLTRCDEREAPAIREAIDILEGRQPQYPRQHIQDWRERYSWLDRRGDPE